MTAARDQLLARRWVGARSGEIVWAVWGDDCIAYHRASGKTHFLNASSRFLIAELLDQPRDFDSILEAFLPGVGDDSAADRRGQLLELLDRLERLGLVSRA